MPDLGRVRFQAADHKLALALGTGIWWCSALSTQHPLMQFMQYTEGLSLHFVFLSGCICLLHRRAHRASRGNLVAIWKIPHLRSGIAFYILVLGI